MTCVDSGSGVRPNFSQTYSSTKGSMLEYDPTAPEMAPVAIMARASRMRFRSRSSIQVQLPNFMPKVMGSAEMP